MPDIVELSTIFFLSFSLALSGALMPGPLLTVTIADSARRGFISGPLLMTGHAILELLLVIAVIWGLGPVIRAPAVMGTIALLGGAILLWMGSGMIKSAAGLTLSVEAIPTGTLSNPVLTGVLASLSNPYWTIWWATIGLGYLTTALKAGPPGIAVFFIGHISADFAWYSVVSYGVSRGREIIEDRTYQWTIRACGIFLLVFGIWFLFSSYSYFTG